MIEDTLTFRPATEQDLPAIVALLADDPLGSTRESPEVPLQDGYYRAFSAIEQDPNNELILAIDGERVAGVLQITFIPYLTYQGSWRALIEGVRVAKDLRSRGVGKALFAWAIERARRRECRIVQLTTDKDRPDALRFYEDLGFVASHEGMKLHLPLSQDPSGGV